MHRKSTHFSSALLLLLVGCSTTNTATERDANPPSSAELNQQQIRSNAFGDFGIPTGPLVLQANCQLYEKDKHSARFWLGGKKLEKGSTITITEFTRPRDFREMYLRIGWYWVPYKGTIERPRHHYDLSVGDRSEGTYAQLQVFERYDKGARLELSLWPVPRTFFAGRLTRAEGSIVILDSSDVIIFQETSSTFASAPYVDYSSHSLDSFFIDADLYNKAEFICFKGYKSTVAFDKSRQIDNQSQVPLPELISQLKSMKPNFVGTEVKNIGGWKVVNVGIKFPTNW